MTPIRIVQSTSARLRIDAARRFVEGFPPSADVTLVGASREATDELVRSLSSVRGATVGLHRFSLLQLASRIASPDLARAGLAPATRLGAEAVAARVTFDARASAGLRYVTPVTGFRGFPRALAATLSDLRSGAVDLTMLERLGDAGHDLRELAARFDQALAAANLADRAVLFESAARAIRGGRAGTPVDRALVLLDVPVGTAAELTFVAALATAAPAVLLTVPAGDDRSLAALSSLPRSETARLEDDAGRDDSLADLRRNLFRLDAVDAGPGRTGAAIGSGVLEPRDPAVGSGPATLGRKPGAVSFFSAPGEGREAVEVVRRVLAEAARGVRFDEIAIVLRAPVLYAGLVETALRRAGVPAWFARGTTTPDPSGRAFLAVLACAAEGLSARRFAEYLSLGQVPPPDDEGAPPSGEPPWVPADVDEQPLPTPAAAAVDAAARPAGQLSLFDAPPSDEPAPTPGVRRRTPHAPLDSDDQPVLEGTLRAPWKWEHLLVESSVIGGGRERWARRLAGLAHELEARRREEASEEPESPRLRRIERDIRDLSHLSRFVLPVIDALVGLPETAPWGVWLEELARLAPMVLRRPDRTLTVLAELRPMSAVGPVALDEVRQVLSERLAVMREDPPKYRYGRVFVGTPDQLRGRSFRIVLVPGLAERIFPHRLRQDPLLLDDRRRLIDGGGTPVLPLPTRDDHAAAERTLLRLAAGAATERLYLSYPRMELTESRPRVPSFYALDVERALTGRLPDFKELEDQAYLQAEARLAWPAPPDPSLAIDDTEHDLAVLGRLLRLDRPADAKGRARYLFELNPTLRRSLLLRYARWQKKWSSSDGLYKPGPEALAALDAHRLSNRAYSVSALQKFAVCPYQFLLSAIHRLEPRKTIEPLERMDPLTRGSIFHRVQAALARALQSQHRLPVVAATLRHAERQLDETLDRVAAEEKENLAPAIERVWCDEVESIRADLKGWLQRVADEGGDWTPCHAEFGFGFPPAEGRDPASVPEPAVLDGRWRLHGFVDLIESRVDPSGAALRVTDHKTGRARAKEGVVVGGGESLQPVLYGMAVERVLSRPVVSARLFYCTAAGGFAERVVSLGPMERRHGLEVLEIVDRAVEHGFLPPAPRDGACRWCDFREVCGPNEELRMARKPSVPSLEDLAELRRLP